MNREKWDLAGLTKEGMLTAHAQSMFGIWVPPLLEIIESPSDPGFLTAMYPVSPALSYPVKQTPTMSLEFIEMIESQGWRQKTSTDGLLEDCIKLGNTTPTAIEKFILKWGPFWMCQTHDYCIWKPSPNFPNHSPCCEWFPIEPLSIFHNMSKRLIAALDLAASLINNRKTDPRHWVDLGLPSECTNLEIGMQHHYLTSLISLFLRLSNGGGIRLIWMNNPKPELTFNAGLGFYPIVWLQLAQRVATATGIYICDGCGKAYIRSEYRKKPSKGRHNFCEKCSQGDKASKRLWKNKMR